MKKLMLPLIFLIVGLAAGAGAFMAFGPKPAPATAGGASAPPAIDPGEPAGLIELDTFLANVSGADGNRFAKLKVRLAIAPESAANKMQNDPLLMARVRDRILTLLTSKSFEELSDPLGKEGFRGEIRMRLNPLVENGEVKEVLFSEFVVQ